MSDNFFTYSALFIKNTDKVDLDKYGILGGLTITLKDCEREDAYIQFSSILSFYHKYKFSDQIFLKWRPISIQTGEIKNFELMNNFISVICTLSVDGCDIINFDILEKTFNKLDFLWETNTSIVSRNGKKITCNSLGEFINYFSFYEISKMVNFKKHSIITNYNKPLCANENIKNKCFVISGSFEKMSKMELIDQIDVFDGIIKNRIDHTVDYLVIGNASSYSDKLYEEALKRRINIIKENDIIDMLEQ